MLFLEDCMDIKIKRIDNTLPLPEYKTEGAVAVDLYSRIDETITPGEMKLIPTNVIVATPPGHMFIIAPRSSLAKKKGLVMTNSVGIIDQDYCGENDEINLLLQNFTKENVVITRGERLGQGMFVKIEKANWQEVEKMNDVSRGGFGTTGQF